MVTLPPFELYREASYADLVRRSAYAIRDAATRPAANWTISRDDIGQLMQHNRNYLFDFAVVLIGAALLTATRYFVINRIVKSLVQSGWCSLRDRNRFAESLYSFIFYLSAFVLAAIIEHEYGFLANPQKLWSGYDLSNRIPALIVGLYALEISHYLHGLYAVPYLNSWSKDSLVLIFHHMVALLLLSISFITRTHRLGVLTLFLHDICDVIMEGCKLLIKLRLDSPIARAVRECFSNLGFACFILFWFVFRLYYFPLHVLHPAVLCLAVNAVDRWIPLSFTLYSLLWFIFSMNIFWAVLIVKVAINGLYGEKIDDIREIDETNGTGGKQEQNGKSESEPSNGTNGSMTNGRTKSDQLSSSKEDDKKIQ